MPVSKSVSSRLLAFLFLSLLVAPNFVVAADLPAKPKEAWKVGMIKDPEGKFGYCLMRADYDNGLNLAIALSGKNEINIGVQIPKAEFGKEEKFPMLVSVDDKIKRERSAVAVEKDLLLTPMGADDQVMDALKRGSVLRMVGPEDTALFALKGTSKGFKELQACVDAGTGKVKMPAPPKEQAAAKSGKGKGPAFPPSLMQLLKRAGLKNIEVVNIPDPAKAPVDLAWRTEGIFGGLRERPVPEGTTVEKMSDIIDSGFKGQCKGMYASKMGDVEDAAGVRLRKADISCQQGADSVHVSLLLYLTDTKLFTMFMHEGQNTTKEAAMAARDKLTATIRQLAKEQKAP